MAKAKTRMIDKNVEKFINSNFGKKEIKKEASLQFELFVNSMHIWQCAVLCYNANTKIGQDMSLGTAQGSDAFFISVNNMEKIFTLKDNIEIVVDEIKKNARSVTFHFIQTKKSESAKWGDFLGFIDIPLKIWKGHPFSQSQSILKRLQDFIDAITDEEDIKLKQITHKIEVCFYTNKDATDLIALKRDWQTDIETKKKELESFFGTIDSSDGKDNVKIELRGESFLNEVYEKLNSNTYQLSIRKEEVIEIDSNKYLIGYVTAKELLDCIAPEINGVKTLYKDIFENNIRLYLGGTDVNKAIETTLREEANKFHFYNNGLTITTKEIYGGNSKNFNILSVNIVNGCQTANSIFNVFKSTNTGIEKVKIPIRVIVAQDKEYEDITIRTNTQNGLEAKDLISIKSIQKEIEVSVNKASFLGKKFYYKRQKSDSNEVSGADYIIHIDDILRVTFSTIMLIPNRVSGYYDITTKKYIDKIFDEKFSKLYTILTLMSKLVKDETETTDQSFSRLHYHICYLMYRFVNKGLDIDSIESYFREKENEISDNEDDLKKQNQLINQIYSNIYTVLKDEISFKIILNYILNIIKINYPLLLDTSDKQKERILYDPVQKLKNTRKTPVFDNFESIFSDNFNNLISK